MFRWTDTQKTALIESILLGISVPPIFVAEDENSVWEVVDGLQRLSTLVSFFGKLKPENVKAFSDDENDDDEIVNTNNKWCLEKGDILKSLEGFNVDTLPLKYVLNIERAIFINAFSFPATKKELLSPYSITMLYSIWEGFVAKSFHLYVDFINEQHILYNELSDPILIYDMESKFKQFKDYPEKQNKKSKFFTDLYVHCQSNVLEIFPFVDTEDNVGFDVLNKLMDTFVLEKFPQHWGGYKYPKPNLKETMGAFLRYRNAVAHGGDISNEEIITQDVYSRYRLLVRDLMYGMHDRFLYGISNETYKKCSDI